MAALLRLIMDAFVELKLAPVDVALPCFDYRMYSTRLKTTRTLSRSNCPPYHRHKVFSCECHLMVKR